MNQDFGFLCRATGIKLKSRTSTTQKLIIKKIDSVRFNYGLLTASASYYNLLEQEILKDYSMGYTEGNWLSSLHSGTFYFYDLNNDLQTSLKIHPVVADELIEEVFQSKGL